jgi:hypothetical protein
VRGAACKIQKGKDVARLAPEINGLHPKTGKIVALFGLAACRRKRKAAPSDKPRTMLWINVGNSPLVRQGEHENVAGNAGVEFGRQNVESRTDQAVARAQRRK